MTTIRDHRIGDTNTFEFQSVSVFGEFCETLPNLSRDSGGGWTGESGATSLRFCQTGDTSRVAAAEAMLDEVAQKADLSTLRREWMMDVAGSSPSVPDFLTGVPECMRRMHYTQSERAPIRVFVCTTSSCGTDFASLNRRGCAILALAIALSNTRPVELWTFTALSGGSRGDAVVKVKIQTSPLALSEACFALTSAGFDRNLTHAMARQHGQSSCGWARGVQGSNRVANEAAARKMLCANAEDLVIPCVYIDDPIVANPVQWVVNTLMAFKAREDENF